ncbi:MAG TPA: patatin-like phospholipase family protein, partial [Burkholderiaceae bacterium]|nr:patatin-like phospholipase family protein [Burkholderiaceae bacterium]
MPPADTPSSSSTASKLVNLALQGGGSHGAFTWGVLDALLEDGRVEFEGITGASAGAMNAAVLADGMLDRPADPREGARQALHDFWRSISQQVGFLSSNNLTPRVSIFGFPEFQQSYALDRNPAFLAFDWLTRVASPYQLNPLNFNPLRDVLNEWIDFERLQTSAPFKLFVCATNVRTGRPRVFRESELTCDMLLASACLPFFFQAPEIGGEHYWDGGFSGNPPLFPLHTETVTRDIVLVAINPLIRPHLPTTATEIIDRVNELSFNSNLLLEMRA